METDPSHPGRRKPRLRKLRLRRDKKSGNQEDQPVSVSDAVGDEDENDAAQSPASSPGLSTSAQVSSGAQIMPEEATRTGTTGSAAEHEDTSSTAIISRDNPTSTTTPTHGTEHAVPVRTQDVFHTKPAIEVAEELDCRVDLDRLESSRGLTEEMAEQRLHSHGRNQLTPPKKKPEWLKFLGHLFEPFMTMLLIAAVLSFVSMASAEDDTDLYLGLLLIIIVSNVLCSPLTPKT